MQNIGRLEYALTQLNEDLENVKSGKIKGSVTQVEHQIASVEKELAAARKAASEAATSQNSQAAATV